MQKTGQIERTVDREFEDEEAKYCEREARRQNQRLILVRTEATDTDLESL